MSSGLVFRHGRGVFLRNSVETLLKSVFWLRRKKIISGTSLIMSSREWFQKGKPRYLRGLYGWRVLSSDYFPCSFCFYRFSILFVKEQHILLALVLAEGDQRHVPEQPCDQEQAWADPWPARRIPRMHCVVHWTLRSR